MSNYRASSPGKDHSNGFQRPASNKKGAPGGPPFLDEDHYFHSLFKIKFISVLGL